MNPHSAVPPEPTPTPTPTPETVVDIAPNNVVARDVISKGSRTVGLILGLFLMGAVLIAFMVLDRGLLGIGSFVAFCMMMLIGLPLTLACVEEAIDHQAA